MNEFTRNFSKKLTFNSSGKKIFVTILSCLFFLVTPVLAQNNSSSWETLPLFSIDYIATEAKAAIAIDAQEIFEISRTEELTAQERAQKINSNLQIAINAAQSIEITIQQHNQLPVIYLNDRHLLTVIPEDTVKGNTVEQQAIIWASELEAALKKAQLVRSPQHIRKKSILALIILVVAIAVDRLLKLPKHHTLPKAIAKRLPGIKSTYLKSNHWGLLFRAKLIIARVILWLVTVYWISDLFPQSLRWRNRIINFLGGSFTTSLFSLGDRSYTLFDLLILAGLFWGLLVTTQTVTTFLRTKILQQTRMSRSSQEVIFICVKYGLIILGAIILLQVWGVNLSSLAILGSALGVGIGFGLQDITKNFASGLVMLFERSVQIGDFIEVNGHRGIVERIQARSIVLKTLDRVSVVVPNSRLLADDVINWSHDNPTSRFALPVGVAYSCDPEVVKKLLLQAAEEQQEVLKFPAPQVLFTDFGDNSLDFELMIWIAEPSRQPVIKSELYFRIQKILRDRAMEIPFPQRDLHFRGNVPLGLSPELEAAFLRWLNKSVNPPPNHNSDE